MLSDWRGTGKKEFTRIHIYNYFYMISLTQLCNSEELRVYCSLPKNEAVRVWLHIAPRHANGTRTLLLICNGIGHTVHTAYSPICSSHSRCHTKLFIAIQYSANCTQRKMLLLFSLSSMMIETLLHFIHSLFFGWHRRINLSTMNRAVYCE